MLEEAPAARVAPECAKKVLGQVLEGDLGNQSLSGTTLAWTSKAVFKDNARNSEAHSFEVVSILRVRSIGAWIEDFQHDPPVGLRPGTLEYSIRSTLADKDGSPGFFDKFEVSILGINLPGSLIGDLPIAGTLQPTTPGGGGVVRPPSTGGGVRLQ